MRVCTICRHDRRGRIEDAIARGVSVRDIAGRYGTSKSAVDRHGRHCIPELLARQRLVTDESRVIRFETVLRRITETLTKLLDACDGKLDDPDSPGAYTFAAPAESIRVTYFEKDAITGKPIRRRASLQQLLVRAGVGADTVDDLSPSPAILMLKTMNLLIKHAALRAKLEDRKSTRLNSSH